jgi:hypothetical protein
MLELPVRGAYEAMQMYDVDDPLLQADFGAAMGAGKQSSPGVFTREYEKATITLDCKKWLSKFEAKEEK